jgi:malonyl CoA-acyl carrier protein transacylase/phosphopantetheinyl transferase (holo-ACP synthase)
MVERGEPWRRGRDIWFTADPLLAGGGKVAFVFPGVEAEFAPRTADVAALLRRPHREWSAADLGQHGSGLVAVGVLLDAALRKINITPHAYAGHSLGEWTAAQVSGLMSTAAVDEFLTAFDAGAVEVSGYAFAAVGAGVDDVLPLLDAYPGVVLTHDNAPAQTVVNGPRDQVDLLVADLRDRRIMCQALPFRSAFHTPVFEPGLRAIGEALGRWQITASDLPVWSATLAAPFPEDPEKVAEIFVRHMVEPVRFRATVDAMYDAGFRVFLQAGPGQLASLIADNLRDRDHLAMPVNVSRRSGLAQLHRVAAALWVEGADPDFTLLEPPHQHTPMTPAHAAAATDRRRSPAAQARPGAAQGRPVAEGARVVAPGAPKGPAIRLDLGGPQISLGEGAELLLGGARGLAAPPTHGHRNGTAARRDGVATRGGAVPPAPVPAARPAPASPAAGPDDTAATLGALRELAQHSSAAAELEALLRETAGDAVTMLSATTNPARPVNGDRPGATPPATRNGPPAANSGPPAAHGGPPGSAPPPAGLHRSVLRVSMETMPYLLDHCFYAQPPDWPHVEDRWPVVPATTVAQHIMDAAAAAVPGMRAVAIREARFTRWLIAAPAKDVEITVKYDGNGEAAVVFGGYARATVELAPAYPEPPQDLWRHDPGTERPPTVSAEVMYAERLMFHGPQFQGVTAVHALGDLHVRGRVSTPAAPGALLDNALQLIGNWIITTQPTRTVALPVRLGRVSFFGPHPAPGATVECVCRIRAVDHEQVVGDCQLVHDGRLWARIEGVIDRRFDSHPTARPAERFPQRHTMSHPQPEGWTLAYDCWTDLVTRGMAARGVLGAHGAEEYDRKPPALRKQWLLGRIAAKDAVRFRQWEAGHHDVFPIELTVVNEPNGRPRVRVRPGRGYLDCDVSLAHCAELGVAIARPYPENADTGAPGVGIDATEVTAFDDATVRFALGPAEVGLLAAAGDRDGWFARFWAAKEAVAKAVGTGFGGRPRDFVVTGATTDELIVTARGRTYRVGCREVGNPPGLPPRRYVVAWTWGPEPGPAK